MRPWTRRRPLGLALAALSLILSGGCPDNGGGPPTITTEQLPPATAGQAYVARVEATGGSGTLTFTVADGSLAPGLTLDVAGEIRGTPSMVGEFAFTVAVADEQGRTDQQPLSLQVTAAPLRVATEALPDGVVGVPYSAALMAEGGTGPYTWTLLGGGVPGIAVGSDGQVAGTPGSATSTTLEVQVADSTGATATGQVSLTIREPLRIVTKSLPPGEAGVKYSASLEATGGRPPYSWSAKGLPSGLDIDAASGTISGTPGRRGTFPVTVRVMSKAGDSAQAQLSLVIAGGLEVLSPAIRPMAVGVAADETLQVAGGKPPYRWEAIKGTPPDGVTLDADGRVSGTPQTVGCTHVRYRVTDSTDRSVERDLTFSVGELVELGEDFSSNPAPIPDTGNNGLVREIDNARAFQVLWASLAVDIAHPNRGHIAIRIISPAGESVRQKRTEGHDNGDDLVTEYDTLTRGFEPLSTFVGTQAQGTWQLRVFDLRGGSSGALRRWTLRLITDECNEPYIRIGPRSITNLGNQPHNLLDYPFAHVSGGGVEQSQIQYTFDVCDPGPNGVREAGAGDDVCRAAQQTDEVLWFTDLLPACLTPRQDSFSQPCTPDEVAAIDPANIGTVDTNGLFQAGYETGFGSLDVVYGGQRWSLPIKITPPTWLVQCLTGEGCPSGQSCYDTGQRLEDGQPLGICAP